MLQAEPDHKPVNENQLIMIDDQLIDTPLVKVLDQLESCP